MKDDKKSLKKKADVIELHKPKDFTEDELRGFWNMFRTPQVVIPKRGKKK